MVLGESATITQFADDTTIYLHDIEDLQYADRALWRWCEATGMRENKGKREVAKIYRQFKTSKGWLYRFKKKQRIK